MQIFIKYNKIYTISLVIGIILMILVYVFDLSFTPFRIELILKVIAGGFFAVSLLYYYKVIRMLHKVTDITGPQVRIAILSHIATLIAIYIWDNSAIFYALFLGSILLRTVTGVTAIDRQMKSICYQLDMMLFEIGKEEEL